MNELEVGKLIARMDNLEKTTDSRHKENKDAIDLIQKKLDILVSKFSEVKGGWFVLTVLGSIVIGLGVLLFKFLGIKSGGI